MTKICGANWLDDSALEHNFACRETQRQNMEHYTFNHGAGCGIKYREGDKYSPTMPAHWHRIVPTVRFQLFAQLEGKGVRIVATWIPKQPLAPLGQLSKGLAEIRAPRPQFFSKQHIDDVLEQGPVFEVRGVDNILYCDWIRNHERDFLCVDSHTEILVALGTGPETSLDTVDRFKSLLPDEFMVAVFWRKHQLQHVSWIQAKKRPPNLYLYKIKSPPRFPYSGDFAHERRLDGRVSVAGEVNNELARRCQALDACGHGESKLITRFPSAVKAHLTVVDLARTNFLNFHFEKHVDGGRLRQKISSPAVRQVSDPGKNTSGRKGRKQAEKRSLIRDSRAQHDATASSWRSLQEEPFDWSN
ncbi:hypothetical protein C8R45DRAFT_947390 [Mycena sanguinolenta]|nr:hypothetical protein C8R45DRAFT_947390 [Mycena sanguinolenta]